MTMMTFLKPLKAQKAFRLILENVRRYRSGEMSETAFHYRATKLWTYVWRSPFGETVDNAYQTLWRETKGSLVQDRLYAMASK